VALIKRKMLQEGGSFSGEMRVADVAKGAVSTDKGTSWKVWLPWGSRTRVQDARKGSVGNVQVRPRLHYAPIYAPVYASYEALSTPLSRRPVAVGRPPVTTPHVCVPRLKACPPAHLDCAPLFTPYFTYTVRVCRISWGWLTSKSPRLP
jgi:hypothetical protein